MTSGFILATGYWLLATFALSRTPAGARHMTSGFILATGYWLLLR